MKIPDVGFPLGTHPTIYEFYEWTRSVLNEGRYQMRVIDQPPDWTTNDGEILAVNDSSTGQKSLYMFITDAWYAVPLTTAGVGGLVPTGVVLPFGGADSAIPSGWALCNGAAADRTLYAALFSVIGVVFGAGDGSTTFNLPDMRQRFPLGVYSTMPALGGTGGAFTGSTSPNSVQVMVQGGANYGVAINTHSHAVDWTNPYLGLNFIIKL